VYLVREAGAGSPDPAKQPSSPGHAPLLPPPPFLPSLSPSLFSPLPLSLPPAAGNNASTSRTCACLWVLFSDSFLSVADDDSGTYALKKFLIQTKEQLQLVKQEIHTASLLTGHPSLLPLLDHAIVNAAEKVQYCTAQIVLCKVLNIRISSSYYFIIFLYVCCMYYQSIVLHIVTRSYVLGVQGTKEAYLLFPVYPEGTLQDHVLWLTERSPLAHPERLTPAQVLHITRQVRPASRASWHLAPSLAVLYEDE